MRLKHYAGIWKMLLLALIAFMVVDLSERFLSHLTQLGLSPSPIGLTLDALGSKTLLVLVALFVWAVVDSVFLPFFKIEEVFFAPPGSRWEKAGEDNVRAAGVLGYFLAFSSVVLAFAFGGAA